MALLWPPREHFLGALQLTFMDRREEATAKG